jgi:hypothetical protein
VTQILEARTKLLQRLQGLSEVRNHLALRAVGILLPSSRQRPATHPGHEARLLALEVRYHCHPVTVPLFSKALACPLCHNPTGGPVLREHALRDAGCRMHVTCSSVYCTGLLLARLCRCGSCSYAHTASYLGRLQTNGAFEVLYKEHELQESLDEVSNNLRKGRAVIVEFNQYFITKVRSHAINRQQWRSLAPLIRTVIHIGGISHSHRRHLTTTDCVGLLCKFARYVVFCQCSWKVGVRNLHSCAIDAAHQSAS